MMLGVETTYLRTFNTPDGESHIEEVDMGLAATVNGEWRAPFQPVESMSFRRVKPGWYADWHVAPRRQYIVFLHGQAEIEMSDGDVRQFGPGSVLLAEDTEGKGHILRSVGADERLSITIPLDSD